MTRGRKLAIASLAFPLMIACTNADAAQCGNGPGGFEAWKQQTAEQARAKGIGSAGISALMSTNYASATIAADRGQRSFGLSLNQFLACLLYTSDAADE